MSFDNYLVNIINLSVIIVKFLLIKIVLKTYNLITLLTLFLIINKFTSLKILFNVLNRYFFFISAYISFYFLKYPILLIY